ncbi:MAG: glycosyltransferase family 4 protein [Acidobacteria bacterium]|nr:glycosyltransferase family 4 protein [Acidobacteriota bacterium]
MAEVVAVTRGMPKPPEPLPPGLRWVTTGLLGKLPFIAAVLREVWADPGFHLLVCAHVNLLPLARVLQIWIRSPLALFVYGIDVWQPTGNLDADLMTRHADALASISEVTARRMYAWSRADPGRLHLLPNAIHLEQYRQDAKPAYLVERYGLEGRRVLLTLGRMASLERYKGFDEILDALPALLEEFPDLVYLAAGEGSDRGRLEAKARGLGLGGRVIFTGMVPEAEKSDHYRLADAYAMPSRGEGFGFVFLEAMACGVPVVASAVDGSREAVLDGELGLLVDPNDPTDVRRGIREALRRPHGIPPGLAHFAFPNFQARVHALVDGLTGGRP